MNKILVIFLMVFAIVGFKGDLFGETSTDQINESAEEIVLEDSEELAVDLEESIEEQV